MKKTNLKLLLLVLVVIAVSSLYYFTQYNLQISKNKKLPSSFKLGNVNNCRKIPDFIQRLKMQQPAIDSLQQAHTSGLLIRDIINKSVTWQHPSWDKSGYVGAFDRDNSGNIYVSPLPYVSLLKNPPAKQNQLYIIDNKTSIMEVFLKLPTDSPPNSKNPFGVMGLFYDCDTNSLYVTSVAGSSPFKEIGKIYQIDLTTKTIVSTLNNVDAIGVGVFNTLKGKKLYFGSARHPHVYAVELDAQGHFASSKSYLFSLSELQGGNSTVVNKFIFKKTSNKFNMILKETEFGFRLMAENNLNKKQYQFQYKIAQDKWLFIQGLRD